MVSITKVKWIDAPTIEELNAILFDIQDDGSNIISVDLKGFKSDGSLSAFVVYHMRDQGAVEKDANREFKETTQESTEDMGSSV